MDLAVAVFSGGEVTTLVVGSPLVILVVDCVRLWVDFCFFFFFVNYFLRTFFRGMGIDFWGAISLVSCDENETWIVMTI